ncbi:MAG: TIGR01777 family oxidoreductase [Candidatus Sumerlaeia bacterium]|nr:TIGR01777 family oxidoreductase [Candidatus Sumerlaeia bacterium]
MRVAVTGSSGLIGRALVGALQGDGHEVVRLVRRPAGGAGEVYWDPAKGFPDGPGALEGCEAVVHLAGVNIAEGRWTAARKRRIRESRVQGTGTLSQALACLESPPLVLVSGSGIGIHGDCGAQWVDESSPIGRGFLADVGRDWEAATAPASKAGIRVVHLRTGVVLSREGGALKKMLPAFRLGLGGVLGSGRQYMSWIALKDEVAAIRHCLTTDSLVGPVNGVTAEPVTNRDFTRTLARVLRRPVGPPAPAFALRLVFGELADEALLASTRARPRRLLESGFQFAQPTLEEALRAALAPQTHPGGRP